MKEIELDLTDQEIADLMRFDLLKDMGDGTFEFTEKGIEALRKQLDIQ